MNRPQSIPTDARRIAVLLALVAAIASTDALAASWWDKAKDLIRGEDKPVAEGSLSEDEIGAGLKDALRVGAATVTSRLGQENGFYGDPAVHIPLPGSLSKVQSALGRIGMDGMLEDLELRLNRAAEIATPKAKALFLQAIEDMTLDDVIGIYNGPDDAATRFFQTRMSAPLAAEMQPIVDQSLAEAGAVQAYDGVMGRYNDLPFVPPVDADLTDYVVDKGIDGIFHYLAQEEAAIRQDPLKRSTDLLKKVFGG